MRDELCGLCNLISASNPYIETYLHVPCCDAALYSRSRSCLDLRRDIYWESGDVFLSVVIHHFSVERIPSSAQDRGRAGACC